MQTRSMYVTMASVIANAIVVYRARVAGPTASGDWRSTAEGMAMAVDHIALRGSGSVVRDPLSGIRDRANRARRSREERINLRLSDHGSRTTDPGNNALCTVLPLAWV